MFDPNSTIKHVHEVRVTMRGVRISETGSPVQVSTRSDFIAPEVSPPSTLAIELDKGRRGWSDYDNKPEVVVINGGTVSGGYRDSSIGFNVGQTVIRKAPVDRKTRVLNVQGPAHRRVF